MTTGFPRETGYTLDTLLQFQAAAVNDTADAVGASDIDLGAAGSGGNELGPAEMRGDLVIDVSVLDVVTGDESYTFTVLGSDNADFTTGDQEDLGSFVIGGATALVGDLASDTGRYVIPFSNKRNTRLYQHLRLNLAIAGTTPSITWSAFVGKVKTA